MTPRPHPGVDTTAASPATVPVSDLPGFEVREFAARWRSARLAACRAVTGDANEDSRALAEVRDESREPLLRAVFDNGRAFGRSAARHFRAEWDLDDVAAMLPRLEAPCFAHPCTPRGEAHVVLRDGCSAQREGVGFVCDYWREALDGLVMGIAHDTFVARHSSRGNGGENCIDVLYVDGGHRKHDAPVAVKFVPLDERVLAKLRAELRRTLSAKLSLAVDGVAEGVVHYRLTGTAEDLSSGAAARLRQAIGARLGELPTPLRALDVSPRPVHMGEP